MTLRLIFALFVAAIACAVVAMVLLLIVPFSVALIHYFPVVAEGTLMLFIGKIVFWAVLAIIGGIGSFVFFSFVLFGTVPSLNAPFDDDKSQKG